MTNNDFLRRIRFAFDIKDKQIIEILALVGQEAKVDVVKSWLKKDDEDGYKLLDDQSFSYFLDGFIIHKRGPKEGPGNESSPPAPIKNFSNNDIFRKVKIALNLKSDDVLDLFKLADFKISKHEISAFFRKKDHKNYRECKDQILRNFLKGVQIKFRGSK